MRSEVYLLLLVILTLGLLSGVTLVLFTTSDGAVAGEQSLRAPGGLECLLHRIIYYRETKETELVLD